MNLITVRIIFSEGQNLTSVFDSRDIIATFRVENTSNSWSFKTKKKTISKELQNTFQKGKRKRGFKPGNSLNEPFGGLKVDLQSRI